MIWQDALFSVCSVALVLAILPAVWGRAKPPKSTCLVTAACLWAFFPAYITMGLMFTAGATLCAASLWTVLLVQRRERIG